MKIVIHRGINQIGGCITEISTRKTRILIDLGKNLPDPEGNEPDQFDNENKIHVLTKGIDAIFYTHYHGDHIGLFHLVPDNIPQYIGEVAKSVVLCKYKRLSHIPDRKDEFTNAIPLIDKMIPYGPEKPIKIGDITVTPYFVSHSAYDAYMFLIEADGKRVLHTGDFRDHGYIGKGQLKVIKKLILPKGRVDFLITEGTMLSRLDERVRHENELKIEVIELMKQYKNVFVICSSTDLERLATFHKANKETGGRPFVCDDFQEDVLKIFSETAGKIRPLFLFDKVYSFSKGNTKLLNWMNDKGFCMLIRSSDKYSEYLNFLKPLIDSENTVLIYSMWKEYINLKSRHRNEKYLDLVAKFPVVRNIHTSGHASADCLASACNLVNPSLGIIPIHSEHSADFQKLRITNELKARVVTKTGVFDEIEIAPN